MTESEGSKYIVTNRARGKMIDHAAVKVYVRNILDKLQLENRTQAALYAVERGIVPKTGE